MSDKDFCEIYSAFYGEEISSPKQVTVKFDGKKLKEFLEYAIAVHSDDCPICCPLA